MAMCKDVRYMDRRINVVGTVERMGKLREVITKHGPRKVCQAFLRDETDVIRLTLWGVDAERIENGYTVEIKNGYATTYQGEKYLSSGFFGSLRIISANPGYNEKPKKLFKQSTNLPSEDMGITIDEQDEDVEYATMAEIAEIAKIERQFWRESLA